MKSALLLYPHQLYPLSDLPKVETVVMVEEPLYFGMDQEFPVRMHKQKLILHRASMRRYVEEVLWPAGFKVEYIDLDVFMKSGDVLDRVAKVEQLFVIDPIDDVLTKRLLQARRERTDVPNITFLANPNFYLKEQEVRDYFGSHKNPEFADFYQWQRERFNVLIDENYKPVGGKWSFETHGPPMFLCQVLACLVATNMFKNQSRGLTNTFQIILAVLILFGRPTTPKQRPGWKIL
jgi:deoxyribodipyrimidine photolyase-related protein